MRLTVLQQQTKSLQGEAGRADIGAAIATRLESVKHLLWHGNVIEALERQAALMFDLDLIRHHSAAAEKLAVGLNDFHTYIRNNQTFIPNSGERYRHGETISTAFVESTINQVLSRRFVKKQQMAWTLRGAHRLLQTRTAVLNHELEDVFRRLVSAIPSDRGLTPDLLLHSYTACWRPTIAPSRQIACKWLCITPTQDLSRY